MSLSPMSHAEFEKWPCRPVDLRGQGPLAAEWHAINLYFELHGDLRAGYSQNTTLLSRVKNTIMF